MSSKHKETHKNVTLDKTWEHLELNQELSLTEEEANKIKNLTPHSMPDFCLKNKNWFNI